MEFTITGIRYQMPGADADERQRQAEDFVCSMRPGTTLYLKAEPDNEWDEKAIAVYFKLRKIGYVAAEQTRWLHPLLEERRVIRIRVSHGDRHVTLFFDHPVDPAITPLPGSPARVIEACPLDRCVRLPFLKEERQLELLVGLLLDEEVRGDDFLEWMESYVSLAKLSLCEEDCRASRMIFDRFNECRRSLEPTIPEERRAWWDEMGRRVRDILGDRHRRGGSKEILTEHMGRLREEMRREGGCFAKYDRFYFRGPLAEAPRERVEEALGVLRGWLERLPNGLFLLMGRTEDFARRITYLKLSRFELYEVLTVMLLVERLEAHLKEHPRDRSLPREARVTDDPLPQEASTPSSRGPRKQFLFIDGKPTVENEQVRRREKARFRAYLSAHKLGSRQLTCLREDLLNEVVICFLLRWIELELIAERPSGGAVFRFLTEECGLVSTVTERSFSNKIKEWLKRGNPNRVTMMEVRDCFRE